MTQLETGDAKGNPGKSSLFFLTTYPSTESVYSEKLIGMRQSGRLYLPSGAFPMFLEKDVECMRKTIAVFITASGLQG